MGIPINFDCGCKIDVWFRFNKNQEPIAVIPSGDFVFCKMHYNYSLLTYFEMQDKMIKEFSSGSEK